MKHGYLSTRGRFKRDIEAKKERSNTAMLEKNQEMKPHAVCVPCPAQGHIHATLKLAKLLHFKGFHITFVHTEFNYNRILASGGPSALNNLADFRFETIPDGLPPSDPNINQDICSLSLALRTTFASPFRDLLKRLNELSSGVPPVTCIISDSFATFTLEAAEEFGIPDVLFCSASACGFFGCIKLKELVERGIVPFRRGVDLDNGSLDTTVEWIPGKKDIRLKDHIRYPQAADPDHVMFNFVRDEAQEAPRASAVIINTFDELEGEVLNAMAPFLPPMYTVGPLTLLCHTILDRTNANSAVGSNNLWKENSECLEWLDGRAAGSVIYLNFGSLAVMTNEQLIEFAWGLCNSGHDFLWVIRPDVVEGDLAVLPREFLEETRGRGLHISWCPQEEVLMHPAVGGFLTHCGWNSTMESISAGVPMLCWPYFGDQHPNCLYACNEWGIGMEIGSDVRREKVEELIRELMEGVKREEMRRNAVKWKDAALKATEVGGKSFVNLDRVINEVLLVGRKD